MRVERAAQYGPDGPWHYASIKNGVGGYPIGYCTTECKHTTEDEACEHYRQWLLDNLKGFMGRPDTLHRCEARMFGDIRCPKFTDGGLGEPGGFDMHHLCDDHRNRETFERCFRPVGSVGEAWVS